MDQTLQCLYKKDQGLIYIFLLVRHRASLVNEVPYKIMQEMYWIILNQGLIILYMLQ